MFGKIAEAKAKADSIRKELDALVLKGASQQGRVEVSLNGNKKILSISINEELLSPQHKLQVEHELMQAIDTATLAADEAAKEHMKQLLGGLPGLGNLFS